MSVGMADAPSFDIIIIGAGSAGAVLANRLSADGKRRVLVLEAGGSDLNPWVRMPIGYGKTYYHPKLNWKYETEPVEGLGGRKSYWPRGKVIGGSSAINAMVYVRGHPEDYDDWALDAPGWAWRDIAPIFKRMEDWSGGADDHRGTGGPLSVTDISEEVHPLCRTYLQAAAEAGIPTNPDYNGQSMEGAAVYQLTTRRGVRASTAACYLRPAQKRANLEVALHAQVTCLVIDGREVKGVAYRQNGRDLTALARQEVILAGGAINSPQILQLSGIGPAALLKDKGLDVVHDAPEVGRNLQDHLGIDNLYRARVPTLNQSLGPWLGRIQAGLAYIFKRSGPLSLSVNQGGGFVRMRPGAGRPDLQLYFSPLSYMRAPAGKRPLMKPDPFPGFLLGSNPCRPSSRGHLEIRTPDPFDAPAIHPNYLATEDDRQAMIDGVRLARRIAETPAFDAVIDAELRPGLDAVSDEDLTAYVREQAWTVFHPCSTCRMGSDPARSVVDPKLRVHGLGGLRIADASIFPIIPSGNTNAPSIMVGEKAADLILEDDGR
ncbi:MAG: GMC family oxidoreductase N-terminal domain-containing protein [Pseudomonadota bacterium]